MPVTLDQIRQQYPDAANATDDQIVQRMSQLSGMPIDQTYGYFGLDAPKPGGTVRQAIYGIGEGAAGVSRAVLDAAGAGASALDKGASAITGRKVTGSEDFVDKLQSQTSKDQQTLQTRADTQDASFGGKVANAIGQAAPTVAMAVANPATAPALLTGLGADSGYNRYKDLKAEGVDDSTAVKAGAADAAISIGQNLLPLGAGGGSLLKSAAKGAAAFEGGDLGGRAVQKAILTSNGYQDNTPLVDASSVANAVTGAALSVLHGKSMLPKANSIEGASAEGHAISDDEHTKEPEQLSLPLATPVTPQGDLFEGMPSTGGTPVNRGLPVTGTDIHPNPLTPPETILNPPEPVKPGERGTPPDPNAVTPEERDRWMNKWGDQTHPTTDTTIQRTPTGILVDGKLHQTNESFMAALDKAALSERGMSDTQHDLDIAWKTGVEELHQGAKGPFSIAQVKKAVADLGVTKDMSPEEVIQRLDDRIKYTKGGTKQNEYIATKDAFQEIQDAKRQNAKPGESTGPQSNDGQGANRTEAQPGPNAQGPELQPRGPEAASGPENAVRPENAQPAQVPQAANSTPVRLAGEHQEQHQAGEGPTVVPVQPLPGESNVPHPDGYAPRAQTPDGRVQPDVQGQVQANDGVQRIRQRSGDDRDNGQRVTARSASDVQGRGAEPGRVQPDGSVPARDGTPSRQTGQEVTGNIDRKNPWTLEDLLKRSFPSMRDQDIAHQALIQGKTSTEIAKATGLSEGRVRQIANEKTLQTKVRDTARKMGMRDGELLEMLDTARHVEAPIEPGDRPGRENTQLDQRDLFSTEGEERTQGMGEVQSAGSSQGETVDSAGSKKGRDWEAAQLAGKDGAAIRRGDREASAAERAEEERRTTELAKRNETIEAARKASGGDELDKAAQEHWDEEKHADHPSFEDLPPNQQDLWQDHYARTVAEEGRAPTLHEQEDWYRANEGKRGYESANGRKWTETTDGRKFNVRESSHDELRKHQGFRVAEQSLRDAGLGAHLDRVSEVAIHDDPKTDAYVEPLPDGQYRLVMGERTINADDVYQGLIYRHEMMHVIDDIGHGGIYSQHPSLAMIQSGEKILPTGAVSRELYQLYKSAPDSFLEAVLDYPLGSSDLGPRTMRAELFAQAGAMYHDAGMRSMLEAKAPQTAEFLRKAFEHGQSQEEFRPGSSDSAAERTTGQRSRFQIESRSDGQAEGISGEPRGSGQVSEQPKRAVDESEHIDISKYLSANSAKSFRPDTDRDADRTSLADKVASKLPKALQGPARSVAGTIAQGAKRGIQTLSFGHDLADAAVSKGLKTAKAYMDLFGQKGAYKNALDKRLGDIGSAAAKLSTSERARVSEYLTDTTAQQKWGHQPDWKNVTTDPAMEKRYGEFSTAAQKLIADVNRLGHEQFQQRVAAMKEVRELLGPDAKELSVPNELDGPYAPLRRHGDYVAVGKSRAYRDAEAAGDEAALEKMQSDPDHYWVQHTSSMGQAEEVAKSLEGKYGWADRKAKEPFYQDAGGATWENMQKLMERGKAAFEDKAQGEAFAKVVGDLYLQSLGDSSARMSELQRKNIPGVVGREMLRSVLENGYTHNGYVSGILHSGKIESAMGAMREEVKTLPSRENRSDVQNYINEFQQRQALQYESSPPWENKLMAFTTTWKLLTSPAHYLQYLSQPYTMSLPLMIGKHGAGRGWRAMVAGMRDSMAMVKDRGIMSPDLTLHKGPAREVEMLQGLKKAGILDIGHEQDYGRADLLSDNKVGAAWAKGTTMMTQVAKGIEMHNRIASALGSYRLAYEDAMTHGGNDNTAHAAGVKSASDNIRQAYGDYSAYNAPRAMMNGAAGPLPLRLMTQFRKFQIIHASLLGRLVKASMAGATPQERAVARTQLGFMATHYGVLAGAMGIPGAQAVGWVLKKMFDQDDDMDSTEDFLRKQIGDSDVANLVLHGAPAFAGVDISNRVGAGDILNPLGRMNVGGGTLTGKTVPDYAFAMMGPAVGMLPNMVDGTTAMAKGDLYNGLTQLMPSGVRDVLKGMHMATEGVTTKRGDVAMSPDEINLADALMQGLGAPTTKVTNRARNTESMYDYEQHFQTMKTDVINDYLRAMKSGDSDSIDAARQRWYDMQAAQTRNGFKPSPVSDLLKARQAQMTRERQTNGGVEYKRGEQGAAQQMAER
jgi:hypothetical protein